MSRTLEESIALHSGHYVEKFDNSPVSRVKRLVDRMDIKRSDVVADFACGNGMLLHNLGDRIAEYHGVDFSQDFIDLANRKASASKFKNYNFHCQDILQFCSEYPDQFNIATTLDFSEHIDDATFIEIYSAIYSALRIGGKLYLHTPNLEFILERLKDWGVMKQFPEHIAVRGPKAYISLLKKCGFDKDKIKITIIPHYNVMKIVHPLSYIPFVGRLFGARLWIEIQK